MLAISNHWERQNGLHVEPTAQWRIKKRERTRTVDSLQLERRGMLLQLPFTVGESDLMK
jgi:hypothetical protein